MEFFLSPNVALFSGVLAAVAAFCVLELVLMMLAGAGVSHMVDTLVDMDTLPDSAILDWLCVKEIPLSVVVTVWLLGFGTTGLAVHAVAMNVLEVGAPNLLVIPTALCGAVVLLRALSRSLTKYKVLHSTALHAHEFIGQRVVLVSPQATQSLMGEAKFTDRHGQTHYVMVRPAVEQPFKGGDVVELLSQTEGGYVARYVAQCVEAEEA